MQTGRHTIAAPRPKRSGEEFARNHTHDLEGPSSKKPRFDYRNPSTLAPDAPEEDTILELDEIGKGGAQTKRNAVNLDGYESDSSNENFDARANAKAQLTTGPSKDEEENDMFADLDEQADGDNDEDLAQEGKKPKKGVRFLDETEIEGQVTNSKSGGHVSADFTLESRVTERDAEVESSSESGGDEERDHVGEDIDEELGAGAKKRHAPKLDAFNMKQEGEEGRFDESGNYVRKATDPDAVHDSWLDGLSKKDMKRAKEAQEKREEDRKKQNVADDAILTSDILNTLIVYMETGETVLETLARLNKGKGRQKSKWQKNKRQNDDDMDVGTDGSTGDIAEMRRKEIVEAVTGAADQLYSRGQPDVYEAERELLMRQYARETGEDWKQPENGNESGSGPGLGSEPSQGNQWQYRWSDARDGGETHGTYNGMTMVSWQEAGYFGEGVEFRKEGESTWRSSVDFLT
ncbi:hypothetical protein EV356DRAFT_479302 [Viridothelium virens]|uniref:GYF domain-containing protein n=1 Tax=Viridothelium virens TaxID=1048519 RepID=A0A6A6HMQ5_VIRVR|nr:hypothetical protein EV356DRAFT_479302 [Viridothelium virens]